MKILIARSNRMQRRIDGASGGVISEILIHYISNNWHAIVPVYNNEKKTYEPKIISKIEHYTQTGSVYHDINLIQNIKKLELDKNKKYIITCLPCEVLTIKSILKKLYINNIVISLFCSGQQTYEATNFLFSCYEISKKNIKDFKFRGNGWPGDITIKTFDDKNFSCNNFKYPWYDILNSNLFTLKKCFFCDDIFGKNSDISAGDPWFESEILNEKKGRTLLVIRNSDIEIPNSITVDQNIDEFQLKKSQHHTLNRKLTQKKYRNFYTFFINNRRHIINIVNKRKKLIITLRKLYIFTYKILRTL